MQTDISDTQSVLINNIKNIKPYKDKKSYIIETSDTNDYWILQKQKLTLYCYRKIIYDDPFLISILMTMAKIRSNEYVKSCIKFLNDNEYKLSKLQFLDENGTFNSILDNIAVDMGFSKRNCLTEAQKPYIFYRKRANNNYRIILLAHAMHLALLLKNYKYEGCYNEDYGGEDPNCTWNAYDRRCSCGNMKDFVINLLEMDWNLFSLDETNVDENMVFKDI